MRRHRVHEDELPAVKVGLHNYLLDQCDCPQDTEQNIFHAFRLYYRIINYRAGQPDYPTILDENGLIQYSVIQAHLRVAEENDPDINRMVLFHGRETYKPVKPPVMRAVASVGGGEGSDTDSSSTHQKRRIINDEE